VLQFDGMPSLPPKVHLIPVPTPFSVGPTNCFLIEGRPLTLVDTGPLTAAATTGLDEGLAALGYKVEDLERLVISHAHVDHFGLAASIKRRSKAELLLAGEDRPMVELFHQTHRRIFQRYGELSRRAGFPEKLLEKTREIYEVFFKLAEDTPVDHVLREGDELDSGIGTLIIHQVPGHTAGSVCLYQRESRVLFSGDTVLRDVTTNPFFGGTDRAKVGLIHYLPSLERLSQLAIDLILPGHGPLVDEGPALIAKIRSHHQRRSALIREILEQGPRRPYDVARELFPKLPLSEVWLALADTMGHLELLEASGELVSYEDQGELKVRPASWNVSEPHPTGCPT
jgi:glyoxylase-like metal-dependent hydrolase (beta-lactamase superfamily II)